METSRWRDGGMEIGDMSYDLIIKNGMIVDLPGGARYPGDVV